MRNKLIITKTVLLILTICITLPLTACRFVKSPEEVEIERLEAKVEELGEQLTAAYRRNWYMKNELTPEQLAQIEEELKRYDNDDDDEEDGYYSDDITYNSSTSSSTSSTTILKATITTLSDGTYVVGRDIAPGTYNLEGIEGFGLITGDFQSGFISKPIGIWDKQPNATTYKNLTLTNGDEFTIESNVTIEFTPTDW